MCSLLCVAIMIADDKPKAFVDDVYFSEEVEVQKQLDEGKLRPYYNKKMMIPIVFEDDSVSQPQDTLCVVH